MTVDATNSSVSYTSDGSTTALSVPFYFLMASQIYVRINSPETPPLTVTVLNQGPDYTVVGAGVDGGGTVNLTVAPAAGWNIQIVRWVQPVQLTSYQNLGPFPAASHEAALDYLTYQVQQILQAGGGDDPWQYQGFPAGTINIPLGSVTPPMLSLTGSTPLPFSMPLIGNRLTRSWGNLGTLDAAMINCQNPNDGYRGTGIDVAGIMGDSSFGDGAINAYLDRDAVARFTQSTAPALFGSCGSDAVYTATTVQAGTWSVLASGQSVLTQVQVGDIIDTQHSTKLTGLVMAVNLTTGTITVDEWRLSGGTTNPDQTGTPANGTGVKINPITKHWGQVTNLKFLSTSDTSTIKGTIHEMGLYNQLSTANFIPVGLDINNLGTDPTTGALKANFYSGGNAITTRGVWTAGVLTYGTSNFGFVVWSDSNLTGSLPTNAFWDQSNSVTAFGAGGGTHTYFLEFSDENANPVANLTYTGIFTTKNLALVNGSTNTILTFRNGDATTYDWMIFEGSATALNISQKDVINASQVGLCLTEQVVNTVPTIYVGIGTASPTAPLHVIGGINCAGPMSFIGAGQTSGAPTGGASGDLKFDPATGKLWANCAGTWKSSAAFT